MSNPIRTILRARAAILLGVLCLMLAAPSAFARPWRGRPPRYRGPRVVVAVSPWAFGYAVAPRPGVVWVPAHYDAAGYWVPGHWEAVAPQPPDAALNAETPPAPPATDATPTGTAPPQDSAPLAIPVDSPTDAPVAPPPGDVHHDY